MIKQEQLVPKRRFEGFNTEWKICKVKEYVELENGHAFKSEYFQSNVTKKIVLTPGNINVGGGFQIDKGHYYDELADYPKKTAMKPGDIFVTMTDLTPTAQTLGFPAIIPDDGNVYLHNQRLGKLVNYDLDKSYLFNLLCTKNYHNQIVMTASGTTVKHSSPQRILNSLISVPSKEEQQKIGEFFKYLDEMIALQQQKIDKIEDLKSAYLAEMFPTEGESVPKRRFEGFTEKWISSKFENIINMHNNLRIPVTASKRIIGYTPYYGANGIQDYVKGSTHNGEFVLIAEDGANDLTNYPVIYVNGKVWVNNHAHVVKGKADIVDNLFLVSRMKSMDISKWLVGGGRAKLNAEILKSIQIKIPDYKEQQKIGEFFKHLDDMIKTHEQKLEKLKATKQAYLHEMFV
ncbi:hypothetical protein GCM10022378_08450 [Salinicoccus jeotgali]|uniref:Type I restriction modification DNA specificity domain-containing protein n=1 Tax=Salinicoccus jeotgali TaxID=381634 RepID=A0ABP7EL50_9STAP